MEQGYGFWQEVERAFDEVQRELTVALDRQHTYGVERLADSDDLRAARVSVRDAEFYHDDVDRRIVDVTVRESDDGVAYHVTVPPQDRTQRWETGDDEQVRERYGEMVARLLDDALQ